MTKRTQDEKRERREQDIITAAHQLIREKGFDSLNMDDLAERAGMSKPTLYQHFKTKDDLIAAAMIQSSLEIEQFILSLNAGSPLERLTQITRFIYETQARSGLSTAEMYAHKMHMLENHLVYSGISNRVGGMLYALLHEGRIQGQVSPTLHSGVMLAALFSLLAVIQGSEFDRMSADEQTHYIESMVRFYIRGISAESV